MKNILQNITVNSAHSITVNDTYFQTLTKAQILSIYDRTTGSIIVADTDVETKVTITDGKTIATDASLPAFVAGHTILITVDAGLIGATALAAEVTAGKQALASVITAMGQNSTQEDSFDQMSLKIKAISTEINVAPLTQENDTWHDLATEVANFYDVDNPYCLAILFSKDVSQVYLTGAAKYKLSDGNIYTGNPGITTFGNNTDTTKKTKYVLYRNNNTNITPNLTSLLGGLSYSNRTLIAYIYGCNLNALNFGGLRLNEIILDESTKIPCIIDGTRYSLSPATSTFNNFTGCALKLPEFRDDATVAERQLTISSVCFQNVVASTLFMSKGTTILTLSGSAMFSGCSIQELYIPEGVTVLNFTGGLVLAGSIYGMNIPSTLTTINFNAAANSATIQPYFLGFYTKNTLTVNFLYGNLFLSSSFPSGFIYPYGENVTLNVTSVPLANTCYSLTLNRVKIFNQTVATQAGSPSLASMYLTAPILSFTAPSTLVQTTVTMLTLASGWNFTINISGSALLATDLTYTNCILNLFDYRADGNTTPTITADGTANIVGVNTRFLSGHHVGETIYVNGVAKVIQAISDETHMTLTTTVAAASGLSYGANKTITINSTVKTNLTASYSTWLTYTQAKGWTVA